MTIKSSYIFFLITYMDNLSNDIIITDIIKEKGNKYIIFSGESKVADVIDEVLVKNHIKKGMSISADKLDNMIEESNLFRAKEKALNLLSFRNHSREELINKIKNSCDKISAEKAVDKMEQLGLVNDKDFANKYAFDLVNIKKFSYNRIKMELNKKGIERDVIDEVLNELCIDEVSQINELLETKFKTKVQTEKGKRQVVNALIRMGYNLSEILNAIRHREEDY